jgi:hypothetical protein
MHHHKYSLDTINNMMPWERYIYIDMLAQYIKSEEDRKKDQEYQRKANR